ncbi:Hint domain-containing protein [Marimonas arenosa]|uniref:Hint domain-containing protein n=1 Tax=Marimonas arenosa TaxID=1795305 RepID=A0AAE3WF13_9RHOB|nr:Hint domain-containing protein [Marimonas arenosa]MDQ2091494.1 Hint domain-containing protein [Marimonas arenosa]
MPGYISEFNIYGGAGEFIELTIPTGTDTSSYSVVIYDGAGAIRQTLSLDPPVTTIAGDDVYLLDPADDGLVNLDNTDAIALVDHAGTVIQFLSWNGNTVSPSVGPAAGMTSTNIGNGTFGSSFETTDDGASYSTQSTQNPGTIPCFALGTRIATPGGARRIETLKIGDEVLTASGAAREIRWVQCRAVSLRDTPEEHRPILIAANALGPGRPARDLVVSAQHRIAVGAYRQLQGMFATPCLVAAKALISLRRVRIMRGKRQVVWYHLALDTHDLLLAEGCVSESLFFGPMVLHGLTRREALSLRDVLPHRVGPSGDGTQVEKAPALPVLRVKRTERMLARDAPPGMPSPAAASLQG